MIDLSYGGVALPLDKPKTFPSNSTLFCTCRSCRRCGSILRKTYTRQPKAAKSAWAARSSPKLARSAVAGIGCHTPARPRGEKSRPRFQQPLHGKSDRRALTWGCNSLASGQSFHGTFHRLVRQHSEIHWAGSVDGPRARAGAGDRAPLAGRRRARVARGAPAQPHHGGSFARGQPGARMAQDQEGVSQPSFTRSAICVTRKSSEPGCATSRPRAIRCACTCCACFRGRKRNSAKPLPKLCRISTEKRGASGSGGGTEGALLPARECGVSTNRAGAVGRSVQALPAGARAGAAASPGTGYAIGIKHFRYVVENFLPQRYEVWAAGPKTLPGPARRASTTWTCCAATPQTRIEARSGPRGAVGRENRARAQGSLAGVSFENERLRNLPGSTGARDFSGDMRSSPHRPGAQRRTA